MYFVGIDISKFKHDCAIVDELGDVITPSWSFQNNCEGFSLLRELLDALDGEKKIGFEATGHYGQNLKLFLESNGFSFMEINPLLISRFVRSKSLRNTKHRLLIDSKLLAERTGYRLCTVISFIMKCHCLLNFFAHLQIHPLSFYFLLYFARCFISLLSTYCLFYYTLLST